MQNLTEKRESKETQSIHLLFYINNVFILLSFYHSPANPVKKIHHLTFKYEKNTEKAHQRSFSIALFILKSKNTERF